MAQTNFTPISLYYSTTAAAVPVNTNLVNGELAINITDGKLYYKNNGGTVTLLASTAGASGDVVGPASATDNALTRFDATTGKLIQNSVGILSDAGVLTGLTGITSSGSITFSSLTSGRVTYATTSGLLTDSANLLFNGTTLTANTLNLTNALGTTYGGTGLTSFTANGVVYASSTSALATGSALTFDGTTLVNTVADAVVALRLSAATGKLRIRPYVNSTNGVIVESINAAENAYLPLSFYGTNIYTNPDTAAIWLVGGSEQMRLTSTGLGIGTTSPSASAILDAQSTTKGVRMPNMTTTQKNAISSPAAGLMVFDTTLAKLCVYSGSAWQTITSV